MSHNNNVALNQEVVVYKGEEVIATGTIRRVAEKLGIQPASVYYYLMPAYQRKVARRKHSNPARVRQVVRV